MKLKMESSVAYVQDMNGNPMMPTRRLGRVRHMLSEGRATIIMYEPFTIRLTYQTARDCKEKATLGIDTGSKHIGISACTDKKELLSAKAEINSHNVKQNLTTRRGNKRNRRQRLRYRKPRFSNRVRTKKPGWLPPSVEHRIDVHKRIVSMVCSILPVNEIILELGKFDVQKLMNPDISGSEYQHGPKDGFENVKAFVRYRDRKYKCPVCGGENKKMDVHHIKFRSEGGSDRPDNLVCVCKSCHKKIHKGKAVLPDNLYIKARNAAAFREAAHMNMMSWKLYEEVCKKFEPMGVKVTFTRGYTTKMNRIKHNIPKTHSDDAFAITGKFNAERSDELFCLRKSRRHIRQLHDYMPRKRERVKETGFKKPVPKRKRKYIRKGMKEIIQFCGFTKRSTVLYNGKPYIITGLRRTGFFSLKCPKDGKSLDSIKYTFLKLKKRQYRTLFIEDVKKLQTQKTRPDSYDEA